MGMVYKICVRCFSGYRYDQQCGTPSCTQLRDTLAYQRDDLEGQLLIAQDMVTNHPDDTSEHWVELITELTAELRAFDQKLAKETGMKGLEARRAARFKQ